MSDHEKWDFLRSRVIQAVHTFGRNIIDDTKERLNNPYPPSGPERGNPATRTGALIQGLDAREYADNHTVTLVFRSSRPPARRGESPLVPEYLERQGRPYFSMMVARIQDQFPSEMQRLVI